MGGYQSKERLVRPDGSPKFSISFSDEEFDVKWIMGGCIPAYRSTFDWLKDNNVGMIITLTIDKLKPGRNINHVPFEHDNTQWTDSDLTDPEDLTEFVIEHVPIADACPPTPANAELLVKVVSNYRNTHPDKKIYFHCWGGSGRTCTAIIYVLMKMYNLTFERALKIIRTYALFRGNYPLKKAQESFLKREALPDGYDKHSEPIVKTPTDHKCYVV